MSPENLNRDKLQKMKNEQMDSEQLRSQLIQKACHDQEVIIGILNFENYDRSFLDMKSQLRSKIDFLTDDKNRGRELKAYIRYLTGISETNSSKMAGAFRSNLLAKLQAVKEL